MTLCVALLRGINVGGRNIITMAALRELAVSLGFASPRTLLQSGNLVFDADTRPAAETAQMLQDGIARQFALSIDVVVRSEPEWRNAIAGNPFTTMARNDPAHLVLMCCAEPIQRPAFETLKAQIQGREHTEAIGSDLYLTYPDGIGTSKLTNAVIERCLRTRGTARNWNTVLKVAEMASQLQSELMARR
jgi:uncharacterized protein (DUF1697 family)